MKNISLIEGLELTVSEAIFQANEQLIKDIKVACDVLEYEPASKTIIVRVIQFAKASDEIFTRKQLVETAKSVFAHLPEGFTLRYRPLIFKGTDPELVSAKWFRNQLKKHGMQTKDLVEAVGIEERLLNQFLEHKYELTLSQKASLFHCFKWLSKLK